MVPTPALIDGAEPLPPIDVTEPELPAPLILTPVPEPPAPLTLTPVPEPPDLSVVDIGEEPATTDFPGE